MKILLDPPGQEDSAGLHTDLDAQKNCSQGEDFFLSETALSGPGFHHDDENMKSDSHTHENAPYNN